ncbi:MAG: universal stress protein [Planctomycetaceae bacterium]|nr:universal stress protein [Planctomycetaceae bacterium]
MRRFRNILACVDLSWCDRFVSEDLSVPNVEAVRQPLWLAKLNSVSVDFFSSLDLSAKAQQLVSESKTDESTVLDKAKARLAEPVAKARLAVPVAKARAEGVVAGSHVVVGKSCLALIRLVLRNDHDLVLVGTHRLGAIKGFVLGSTGIKLLRKCPSAVWINQSVLRPRPCQGVGALRRHGV